MRAGTARRQTRLAQREQRVGLGCGLAAITGTSVLGIILLGAFLLFMAVPRGGPAASAVVQRQTGAAVWNSSQRATILLVGTAYGRGATSFTVLSYTPASHRLILVTIPANLWVTVPGYGQAQLGQSYADGGTRLMLLTVQSVLATPLPYYAIANAGTITKLVDAFGGISVRLPGRITLGSGSSARAVGPGLAHLGGTQVARYFSSPNGYGYLEGQSMLLALLRATQSPDNVIRLPSVLNSLGPSIDTNFPLDRVPDLLHRVGRVGFAETTQTGIGPYSYTATSYTTSGMQVFLPRWDRIHSLAHELLAGPRPAGAVEVLNGSGIPGQAAALTTWLRSARVPVRGFATAPNGNYPRTEIRASPNMNSSQRSLAGIVAALLRVPIVTGSVPHHAGPIAVIIGRDYEDPAQ